MNYIGFDIGGSKMAIIISDKDFNILSREEFKTSETITPSKTLGELLRRSKSKLIELEIEESNIESIGISCGGPLDSNRGVIMSPPNLPTWDDVRIVEFFKKHYNKPVFLQNDANACALVEWQLGAGKGLKNMVFLTFGTGMGAGLILDGKLYTGTNDMAGEIGHIRLAKDGPVGYGKKGSFEGFCSGGGIKRLAEYRGLEYISAKEVIEDAYNGNKKAMEVIRESARYLGRGLAILIDILNPEAIVIGSIYTRCEDVFRNDMLEILEEECLSHSLAKCEVKVSETNEKIGDYASLIVAKLGLSEYS